MRTRKCDVHSRRGIKWDSTVTEGGGESIRIVGGSEREVVVNGPWNAGLLVCWMRQRTCGRTPSGHQ